MTAARPAGGPALPVLDDCCAPGCSCASCAQAQARPERGAEERGAEERGAEWHRAARAARWLSWFSLAWMTAEGALGLTAGVGGGSISLVATGTVAAMSSLSRRWSMSQRVTCFSSRELCTAMAICTLAGTLLSSASTACHRAGMEKLSWAMA